MKQHKQKKQKEQKKATKKGLSYKITTKLFALALYIIAAIMLIPPIISNNTNAGILSTYQTQVTETDTKVKEEALEKAKEYNDLLFQTNGISVPGVTDILYDDDYYRSLLNLSGTSVMGRIEIPKISVDLPIYHGTGEDALSNGVGHLQGSSLPVGGNSTRAILSGHRASPNAELFSRLDELKEGDFVFLEILDSKLAYRVAEIEVIEPENVEGLETEADQDLITLVTCTPWGTNKYRLCVTCERVEFSEQEKEDIDTTISVRETGVRIAAPVFFILLGTEFFFGCPVTDKLLSIKKKGKGEKNEEKAKESS